ncbi:MAG: hypothetical protein J7L54_02940 [Elusimicrobia bacterium]|nr:hypothetical protein [Elusimicrobiota bacterium]
MSLVRSAEISINFLSTDYDSYYDSSSNVIWNIGKEMIYLSTGTSQTILRKYKTIASAAANPQSGFTFLTNENCFIVGFARYAPSGNPMVRLWTDDPEENSFQRAQPWAEISCGVGPGWQEQDIDFLSMLYPLSTGNEYWIAVVKRDEDTQQGKITSPSSGTGFITLETPYWYLKNVDPLLPETLEGIGTNLMGVADLKLNQFESSGYVVTKAVDLLATQVDIESFNVTFDTSIYMSQFDQVTRTGVLDYKLRLQYIVSLMTAPVCYANFRISSSSDGVNFGSWLDEFASIHSRYIKIKMNLGTGHRGITPFVDGISINYNAYPERIEDSSVLPADDSMVTTARPQFRWKPSYDLDGDTVTYNFSLSTISDFTTVVFSTQVFSNPASTYVFINCPVDLSHRVTYYFAIDMADSQGALVPHDKVYKFETELLPFSLVTASVADQERLLASSAQNGIDFTFLQGKEVDLTTVSGAVDFRDSQGKPVSYNTIKISANAFRIQPTETILPCEQYSIELTTALKDTRGLNLTQATLINFLTLNDPDDPYTAEVPGGSMEIPSSGSPVPFYLQPAEMKVADYQTLSQSTITALASGYLVPISSEVVVFDISDINAAEINTLRGALLKIFYYSDSFSVGGISVPAEKLRIFRFNDKTNQWVLVEGAQSVDTSERIVSVSVTKGGKFALFAMPANSATSVQLRNVPNPFFNGDKTEISYYLNGDASVKLKIYTQIGNLIYEKSFAPGEVGGAAGLNASVSDELSWDGKNSDGATVASGIYILKIEINYQSGGSETRTRKIGFIR